MTTLEKMAKAILDSVMNDSSGPGKISSAGTEVRISGEVQFYSRRVARAAIEALKDADVEDYTHKGPRWSRSDMDRWNDKIDAILKET